MLENKQLAVAIARHVFPGVGSFSGGPAKFGQWDTYLVVGDGVTWCTVQLGSDVLFQIEARGGCVTAKYALPAVMASGRGETAPRGPIPAAGVWSDISLVAADIRKFFDNHEEFCRAETEVYKTLGSHE